MPELELSVEETAPVESPTVVVVETPAEPTTTPLEVDLITRVTRVEDALTVMAASLDEIASRLSSTESTADVAIEIAGDAQSTAIDALITAEEVGEIAVETADETGVLPEVLQEVAPEVIDTDESPRKTHPLFRSMEEWKTRVGN